MVDSTCDVSDEARALHDDALVIDLHADTLIPMRAGGYDISRRHRWRLPRSALFFHCDLPRWRDGGVNGQFFGLVTVPYPQRGCAAAIHRQIDLLERVCRENPGAIRLARSVADLDAARAGDMLAALMGIEGAHNLEGDIANLQVFYDRGVRYVGLAHFTSNSMAPAAFGAGSDNDAPLPGPGCEFVERANELGMIVDLAHLGRRAFMDVVRRSRRPLLVSHTGVSAICDVWRNINDDQLRGVADTDGVVGIIFARRFISCDRVKDSKRVVAHLDHIRRTIGARHAALGSDFDGAITPVDGLRDVSHLPILTQYMLDSSWPEEDIRAALGENVRRIIGAHEPVDVEPEKVPGS